MAESVEYIFISPFSEERKMLNNQWMTSGTWHFFVNMFWSGAELTGDFQKKVQKNWCPLPDFSAVMCVCVVCFRCVHHCNPWPLTGCCFVFINLCNLRLRIFCDWLSVKQFNHFQFKVPSMHICGSWSRLIQWNAMEWNEHIVPMDEHNVVIYT